jgi:predicted small metal-binding protein
MAKSFECRRGGVVCNFEATGESDDEVLKKAVEHARKAHGLDLSQSSTLARYAQSLIRDEGAKA